MNEKEIACLFLNQNEINIEFMNIINSLQEQIETLESLVDNCNKRIEILSKNGTRN